MRSKARRRIRSRSPSKRISAAPSPVQSHSTQIQPGGSLKPLQPEAMPTKERMRQAGYRFEVGGEPYPRHQAATGARRAPGTRVIRMTDAPLDRIYAQHQLTPRQHEALQRLREHWYLGHLAGSMRAMDLDRVRSPGIEASEGEPSYIHREAFRSGWGVLHTNQKTIVQVVVLADGGLTSAGAELGYRSPYRGRMAALDLLQGAANRLVTVWGMRG